MLGLWSASSPVEWIQSCLTRQRKCLVQPEIYNRRPFCFNSYLLASVSRTSCVWLCAHMCIRVRTHTHTHALKHFRSREMSHCSVSQELSRGLLSLQPSLKEPASPHHLHLQRERSGDARTFQNHSPYAMQGAQAPTGRSPGQRCARRSWGSGSLWSSETLAHATFLVLLFKKIHLLEV